MTDKKDGNMTPQEVAENKDGNAEKYEVLKQAVIGALNRSLPYVSKYNAFLITAEDWTNLANITMPHMAELDKLLAKQARGEKITKEEVDKWLAMEREQE